MLQAGRQLRQYVAPNPAELNSATEVYLQVGMDEGDDWLHLTLLSQLMEDGEEITTYVQRADDARHGWVRVWRYARGSSA